MPNVVVKNRYPHGLEETFVRLYRSYVDELADKYIKKMLDAYWQDIQVDSEVEGESSNFKTAAIAIGTVGILKNVNFFLKTFNKWNFDQFKVGLGLLTEEEISFVGPVSEFSKPTKKILKKFATRNAGLIKDIRLELATKVTKAVKVQVRKDVAEIAAKAVTKGKAFKSIRKEIQRKTGVIKSKAEFWARDQITKLYGNLTTSRIKETGAPGYIWMTVVDGRVRESHAQMHGKFFTWEQISDIGLLPGEDYQCRCDSVISFGRSLPQKAIKRDQAFIKADRKRIEAKEKIKSLAKQKKRAERFKTVPRKKKERKVKSLVKKDKTERLRVQLAESKLRTLRLKDQADIAKKRAAATKAELDRVRKKNLKTKTTIEKKKKQLNRLKATNKKIKAEVRKIDQQLKREDVKRDRTI